MEAADPDLESILLGYEGNALFMNGQHKKSTEILEIGMRLYPQDYRFQRALATVSEKWAEKVLGLERSKRTIQDVQSGIRALERSHRLYVSLSKIRGEKRREMYDKKANHVAKMLELSEQHIAAQHDEERKQQQKKRELRRKWDAINDKRERET